MSKKRTSPEASRDEQTNERYADLFEKGNDVKRAKLSSLSETTLLDLPPELIESIFVRAIVMEVKEIQLTRSESKAKADLVISRLSSVSPDWSNILTTNFFHNELYRMIDRTVEKTFRLEILHSSVLDVDMPEAVTLRDELFILCRTKGVDTSIIQVYDRNNMAAVKDVIDLSEFDTEVIAACHVSNCLYIVDEKEEDKFSVLRIMKEDEHRYSVSPFISADGYMSHLSVAANGNIILWNMLGNEESTNLVVYDATGSLQHKMKLPSNPFDISKIIPMTNGNLVVVSNTEECNFRTTLTEIDMNGTVLRQYQSSLGAYSAVCLADSLGRIVIAEWLNQIELLDSEFNLLNVIVPQLDLDQSAIGSFYNLQYNSDTNEVVAVSMDRDSALLFIFRFNE